MAEFTRAEPSAGSFITYVETGLGPRAGVVTALLVTAGYTVAMTGVFTMSGGLLAMTLAHYTSLNVPWGPLTLVLTVAAIWVTAKGVKLSTSAVGIALVAQVSVMLAVCVAALAGQGGRLSAVPFSWAHLTGGLTGSAAAREAAPSCVGYDASKAFDTGRLGQDPAPAAVAEGGVVVSLELCYGLYAGYAVAAVRGELDITSSPDVASAIACLAKRRQVVIVELSELEFIDCGALGALLRVQRAARQGGGDVLLAAPAANVLRLLSLTGMDEAFSVHASAAAAVVSIGGSLEAVASPRSEPAAEAGSLAPALSGSSG